MHLCSVACREAATNTSFSTSEFSDDVAGCGVWDEGVAVSMALIKTGSTVFFVLHCRVYFMAKLLGFERSTTPCEAPPKVIISAPVFPALL